MNGQAYYDHDRTEYMLPHETPTCSARCGRDPHPDSANGQCLPCWEEDCLDAIALCSSEGWDDTHEQRDLAEVRELRAKEGV